MLFHELFTNATRTRVLALATFLVILAMNNAAQAQHIAGYAWPDNHTQHVIYIGLDDDIHELYYNGNWWHSDLIQNNCSRPKPPHAAGNGGYVSGFVWTADSSEHVIYVGNDLHLHELWLKLSVAGGDNCWHHTDLTNVVGGTPRPDPTGGVVGYEWPDDGSEHFVYKGFDGYVHEIYNSPNSGWGRTDFYGDPPALGPMVGYVWPEDDTEHIVYLGTNQQVYELYLKRDAGGWGLSNPSSGQLPADETALTAYVWPQDHSEHIMYVSAGGVFELYLSLVGDRRWHEFSPSGDSFFNTSFPAVDAQAKSLIGYAIPWAGTERVIYVDYSNHLHTLELVPNQHWLDGDLIHENTQVNPRNPPPLANPSALTGYVWNQTYTEHVIYLDCNNGVNELWGQDLLNYNNLTLSTGAPPAAGCSF
jgi:hypothetical protein